MKETIHTMNGGGWDWGKIDSGINTGGSIIETGQDFNVFGKGSSNDSPGYNQTQQLPQTVYIQPQQQADFGIDNQKTLLVGGVLLASMVIKSIMEIDRQKVISNVRVYQ